ncbi:DUF362 domain-containing protein [candidate division KSB1 bacterium]|nr:DUF362 domain-containing protein [candidate division KSB1 bacterium]
MIGYLAVHSTFAGNLDVSRVVIVKDEKVLDDRNRIQPEILQTMMDAGICAVTGQENVGKAWGSLFPGLTSEKIISIKASCLNSQLSSHPEVAQSIINGLVQLIVDGKSFPENNIIIWDRTDGDLRNAGYTINTSSNGVRCYGTNNSKGGLTSQSFNIAGSNQKLSKILTEQTDYLINFSALKNHGMSGVTLSMKNHYGSVNNPGGLHGGNCDPYLAALNNVSFIRDKQVINICDAVFGIVSGGPGGRPQVTPKSLIFSTDTVAHDYIGMQMLKDYGMGSGSVSRASHIKTAASSAYNLGTDDPDKIQVFSIENPVSGVDIKKVKDRYPSEFMLESNYPNPFNPHTTVPFHLQRAADIKLEIFDMTGKRISVLAQGYHSAGSYEAVWNGLSEYGSVVSSGTYICRLQAGKRIQSIKMQLLK